MINVFGLAADPEWDSLQQNIDRSGQNPAVKNILGQVRRAGAISALVETDYLDRDFSDEFKAFYSTLFARFRRHTRRLHFFACDAENFFRAEMTATDTANALTAASQSGQYLGFIVIRPVEHAPLGKAILRVLESPADAHASQRVRADYVAHVLGAKLRITDATPFTQQDSRVSACAQASIWVAGRHIHAKHGGPWISTVAITEAASKPTDETLASSLPAGAGGLSTSNMIRAIRAMDRYPLAYSARVTLLPDQRILKVWPNTLDPVSIVARYVNSGIPVILCLLPFPGQTTGHAVVATGTIYKQLPAGTFARQKPDISEFIEHFLVQDDQRGINLRMPKTAATAGDTQYNFADFVYCVLVPLPDKVFLTAEIAERIAWDQLERYRHDWPRLKENIPNAPAIAHGDAILSALANNEVAARTYLTRGWRHIERLVESEASEVLKKDASRHELPRMAWVTEFSTKTGSNHLNPAARRIFGYCLSDATAIPFQPPLALHLPGFLWLRAPATPDFYAKTEEKLFPIADDRMYALRRN